MLDSGFMPPFRLCSSDRNVTGEDVMLPLGRNSGVSARVHKHCLHYTHCLMRLSVACNLIPKGVRMIT